VILTDGQIRLLALKGFCYSWSPDPLEYYDPANVGYMIKPFSEAVSGEGRISYGLTSSGYDFRLAPELRYFKTMGHHGVETIDPKRFKTIEYIERVTEKVVVEPWVDSKGNECSGGVFTLPPRGYVLGRSVEYFNIPSSVQGRCLGKSTYARCGILINATPLEPGWEGHLVVEIANCTDLPVALYINEGIGQVVFYRLDGLPEVDYRQKSGKYQGQTGVTMPRVL
jgi:dCTP deaminase